MQLNKIAGVKFQEWYLVMVLFIVRLRLVDIKPLLLPLTSDLLLCLPAYCSPCTRQQQQVTSHPSKACEVDRIVYAILSLLFDCICRPKLSHTGPSASISIHTHTMC